MIRLVIVIGGWAIHYGSILKFRNERNDWSLSYTTLNVNGSVVDAVIGMNGNDSYDTSFEWIIRPAIKEEILTTNVKKVKVKKTGDVVQCGDEVFVETAKNDKLFLEHSNKKTFAGNPNAILISGNPSVFKVECYGKEKFSLKTKDAYLSMSSSHGRFTDIFIQSPPRFSIKSPHIWLIDELMTVRTEDHHDEL